MNLKVIEVRAVSTTSMEEATTNQNLGESKIKLTEKEVRNLWKEFFQYTTAHGVGRLASVNGTSARVFWALCVVGAVAMFIHEVVQLFTKFWFLKPTVTTLTMEYSYVRPYSF